MSRIAVLSDTHDWMPSDLPARLAGADEIWHLGDVCEPAVLAGLKALDKPLHVVLGNNEAHTLWPEELWLERAGRKFYLIHIPPFQAPAGAQYVLHGHTHVPRDQTDAAGVRWLNPGAIKGPKKNSQAGFAWLVVEADRPPEWWLEAL